MVYEVAAVEIGQHFYWNLNGFLVHGQVLINSWIVFAIILVVALITTSNVSSTISGNVLTIASAIAWCPKQTPKSGLFIFIASATIEIHSPASFGVPGPGESKTPS